MFVFAIERGEAAFGQDRSCLAADVLPDASQAEKERSLFEKTVGQLDPSCLVDRGSPDGRAEADASAENIEMMFHIVVEGSLATRGGNLPDVLSETGLNSMWML